jgi:hypothetical protein
MTTTPLGRAHFLRTYEDGESVRPFWLEPAPRPWEQAFHDDATQALNIVATQPIRLQQAPVRRATRTPSTVRASVLAGLAAWSFGFGALGTIAAQLWGPF